MATPKTGRPRGRPKGSVNSRQIEIREAIAKAAPELVQKLITAAHDGDMQAAVALIDRIAPKVKPTAPPIFVDLSGDTGEVYRRILKAVGSGQVPVDLALEAAKLAGSLPEQAGAKTFPDRAELDARYAAARAKWLQDKADITDRARKLENTDESSRSD